MHLNLFFPWYNAQTAQRRLELEFALYKNLTNPWFSKIIVFEEAPLPRWVYSRNLDHNIYPIPVGERSKFKSVLSYIRLMMDNSLYPTLQWNIISNTDIFFGNSISVLKSKEDSNTPIVLTRHERGHRKWYLRRNHSKSQDVWCIRGRPDDYLRGNYEFGQVGCDNRFAWELKHCYGSVENLGLLIKAYHVHPSAQRFYSRENEVGPPYLAVPAQGANNWIHYS